MIDINQNSKIFENREAAAVLLVNELKKIIDKIEVSEFTVIEPTLNRIFIELIKKNSAIN